MASYAKAIAVVITSLVLSPLLLLGITGDTSISDAINLIVTAVITTLAVYLTPNKVQ